MREYFYQAWTFYLTPSFFRKDEKMKDYYFYINFKLMPVNVLQQWLDKAYEWRDEKYILKIKQEFKRRGLKPKYV